MNTYDSSLFVKEVAKHILPHLLEEMSHTEKWDLDDIRSDSEEAEKEVFKKTV